MRRSALRASNAERAETRPDTLRTLAMAMPATGLAAILIAAPELRLTWSTTSILAAAGSSMSVLLLLATRERRVAAAISVLVLALGWAWGQTPQDSPEGLRHFAGAVAGLLVFAAVRVARVSPTVFRAGMQMLAAVACAGLSVGLASVHVEPTKQVVGIMSNDFWVNLPRVALPVAGLIDGLVNSNALASAALLIVPMLAGAAMEAKDSGARAAMTMPLLAVLLGIACLIVSLSRTAFIVSAVVVLVTTMRLSTVARRGAVAAMLVIVMVFASAPRHRDVKSYLDDLTGQIDYTVNQRVSSWKEAVMLIRAHPATGIGLNQFHPVGNAHADNLYLQTLLDLGIIGAAAYFAFWIWVAQAGLRGGFGRASAVPLGAALSIVAIHLFGLADAVAIGARVGMFQWFAGALALGGSFETHKRTG